MTLNVLKCRKTEIKPKESSLCAQRIAKDPNFLHADSEDWSDWADLSLFMGTRAILLALSWGGSYYRIFHVILIKIKL